MPTLRRTDDLDAIRALCVEAGLDMQNEVLTGIVTAYGAYLGDKLVGCATLQRRDDNLFLEYVAVDKAARQRGIGALLVQRIEDEARARGLTELWAKAKSPEFYQAIGFRVLQEGERGPKSLDGCVGCPQFRSSCFPAIVVKHLV